MEFLDKGLEVKITFNTSYLSHDQCYFEEANELSFKLEPSVIKHIFQTQLEVTIRQNFGETKEKLTAQKPLLELDFLEF
jgi:hypothetical protein